MTGPVTAVVGMDMKFFDRLPELFPPAKLARGQNTSANPCLFRVSSVAAFSLFGYRILGALPILEIPGVYGT